MTNPRDAFEVSSAKWRSTVGRVAVTLIILAVLLFAPAGRITWTRGWLFLLVFTLLMFGVIGYFRRVNPQMFAIRSRVHPETKRWDKFVIGLLFLAMFAIPLVISSPCLSSTQPNKPDTQPRSKDQAAGKEDFLVFHTAPRLSLDALECV